MVKKFKPFEEARSYEGSLGLQTEWEWKKYIYVLMKDKRRKPKDIPTESDIVYKDTGWIGFKD